jgi:hypothetical protein
MVNMGMLIIWDVHTGSIQSASDIDVAWGYSLTLQNFVIIGSPFYRVRHLAKLTIACGFVVLSVTQIQI